MHSRGIFFLAVVLTLVFVSSGFAQMSANPAEVGQRIRAMGNALTPEVIGTTGQLYAPLLKEAPKDGAVETKDVKYGPDERNRLDVYQPEKKGVLPSPILVFVHGGGFVRGDKSEFENFGVYFARRGILTITMDYRFAPKNTWPSGAEDIAAVLKWIRANGQKYGGDVNKVFLMGTSAGAAHVATYVFFDKFQLKDGDRVAGAILFPALPTIRAASTWRRTRSITGKMSPGIPRCRSSITFRAGTSLSSSSLPN